MSEKGRKLGVCTLRRSPVQKSRVQIQEPKTPISAGMCAPATSRNPRGKRDEAFTSRSFNSHEGPVRTESRAASLTL